MLTIHAKGNDVKMSPLGRDNLESMKDMNDDDDDDDNTEDYGQDSDYV